VQQLSNLIVAIWRCYTNVDARAYTVLVASACSWAW
jgi:hypothetical protein